MHISALYRYPVKSAAGIRLDTAQLDRFGIAGDRRWMLVDPDGGFVTQRELASLATLAVSDLDDGLVLSRGGSRFTVPRPGPEAASRTVTVWKDAVEALDAGDPVSAWLFEQFRRPLRLVYLPDSARRPVDPDYAGSGDLVAFADGFPLLLTTDESLAELNTHLSEPIGMARFRPNLVVTGAAPYAEDGWRSLRVGGLEFRVAKPCSRCVIPSIDPRTGISEPRVSRVLAACRRIDGAVYFGQNLLSPRSGTIRVGDPVVVIDP
jgi:hypothetical protein